MDINSFRTLRMVLQSTDEAIAAMDPIGTEISIKDRKYREIPADGFRDDVGHFMRLHNEPNFRGYIYPPTTCDNTRCPMYNGGRWMFVFHMDGELYKNTWSFKLDDHAIDTECGDHSWLDAIS